LARKSRRRRKSLFDEIIADMADLFDGAYEQFQAAQDQGQYHQKHHGHGPQDAPPQDIQPVQPLTVEENQLYMEIVELGFREAIKKYHPDRGGDPEKAACVNALRDKIHLIAGVKK
jgi:hypothetical protein